MRKTLYKYILLEQLFPMFVAFMGLSIVFISGKLGQLFYHGRLMSGNTLREVMEIMALLMPNLMMYILPIATQMGILNAFVRLSSDNELTALRSMGIGFKSLFPAVFTAAMIPTIISLYTSVYLAPTANFSLKIKMRSLGQSFVFKLLKEKEFVDLIPGYVFFFSHIDYAQSSVEGAFIQTGRHDDIKSTIIAKKAKVVRLEKDDRLFLKILNGSITHTNREAENIQNFSFNTYALSLSNEGVYEDIQNPKKKEKEMTMRELYHKYRETGCRFAASTFHERIAFPFACLLLGMIAAPLGVFFYRSNKMMGVTISLAVFLIYYILMATGDAMNRDNLLTPFASVWFPNIFILALSIWLWVKTHRETPIQLIPYLMKKR